MPFYEDYAQGQPKTRRQRNAATLAGIGDNAEDILNQLLGVFQKPKTTWYVDPASIGLPSGIGQPLGSAPMMPTSRQYAPEDVLSGNEIDRYMINKGVLPSPQQRSPEETQAPPNIFAGTNPGIGGGNPLFRRLLNAATNVPIIDYDQLISENAAAIRAAYAPQIKGLRRENKATNREFSENQGIIDRIASQMENRYGRQAGRAENQAEREQEAIQQETNKRAAGTRRTDLSQTEAITDYLGKIGGEEAAGQLVGQILRQGGQERKEIRKEGRSEKTAARKEGEAEEKYLTGMAMGARQMGLDAVADLIDQRNAILRANRTGIQELKGLRGQEVTQMTTGLNMQEAQDQLAAESMTWDRLMSLAGLKEEQRQFNLSRADQNAMAELDYQMQLQQAQQEAASTPPDWMDEGYFNYSQGVGAQFGPQQQTQAMALINQLAQEPQFGRGQKVSTDNPILQQMGYTGSDTPATVTPELIGQYLKYYAMKQYGWPEQQANKLLNLGLTYGTS